MRLLEQARAFLRRLQWRRGVRAALAVAAAILVCRRFGQPYSWAALGAFEAILVDNGGPYRSRLDTILTVLAGGAVAGLLGAFVGSLIFPAAGAASNLWLVLFGVLTGGAVCFAFTFARVLNQPFASTSAIILVIFFSGLGSGEYHLAAAAANVALFVGGGLGAAVLSLLLWPLDPFRPVRQEVAAVYALLAEATLSSASAQTRGLHHNEHDWKRRLRVRMESARTALTQTPARVPARTLRARNLTVLLESADMLFERAIRFAELAELTPPNDRAALQRVVQWIGRCENTIAQAVVRRPADAGVSLAPQGLLRLQLLAHNGAPEISGLADNHLRPRLHAEQGAAREEIEIAFDAVRTLWSGQEDGNRAAGVPEARNHAAAGARPGPPPVFKLAEKVKEEFSVRSPMFRHAWRIAVVGTVDVLLLWFLHLDHGAWLGLTSIIVLQPNGSGTLRRAWQRVAGTVAGGFFAAGLAAGTLNQVALLIVVTVCAGLTLACFAVDYGLYSFFLTPTFVLLSLPRLGDWRYAGLRIELTVLGASIALLATRLLWPEREQRELGRRLLTGAQVVAAYLRVVLRLWQEPTPEYRRLVVEARRACGLASNAAEETLDSLLLQPSFGRQRNLETAPALTFTTYLRRLTQSVTHLASLSEPPPGPAGPAAGRLQAFAERLEALQLAAVPEEDERPPEGLGPAARQDSTDDIREWQMRRIERQISVLERAAVVFARQPAILPGLPP